MIDLHTHVLPGVDDGCGTLEESLELAAMAVEDGIQVIAATPHVRSDYPTDPGTMERLVAEVRRAVAAEGLPLDVRSGGELALDWLDRISPDEVRRFGLGGNPTVVLVEFPYAGWPFGLEDRIFRLQAASIVPVLAHPERNAEVQETPQRLRPLVERGVLVQVTAASLEGRLGRSSRTAARTLVDSGLAHMLASDAHTPDVRRIGLAAAADTVGDGALARWLTVDVPRALLDGAPLPVRPSAGGRRGGRFFRRP